MATLFEAYVTNAGKYSEGQLVGETLKFPTTAQEVEALLKRIGVDGVRYQEIFITSFDGDVLGLYDHLSEYENLDELNHLACLLSELTSSELETLEAVLDSGDHCSSVRDIINLTQNLDCYGFYPGVSDEETLGRIYVDDLEMLDVPDQVKPYFDYEAYGRDACIHENGHFAPGGYVVKESDHFVEVYHGEFNEERLIRALRSVHPMEIYRTGMDNPAKLPGWKKYVFPIYAAYNGKSRKDALPMKF